MQESDGDSRVHRLQRNHRTCTASGAVSRRGHRRGRRRGRGRGRSRLGRRSGGRGGCSRRVIQRR